MSESHSPTTDTQALLQSMLQRLKLQPGTGSQGCQHQTSPTTAAPSQGQNGGRGDPNHKTVSEFNSIPVNGFGTAMTRPPPSDIIRGPAEEGRGGLGKGGREMRKWDSQEEFGIPVWDFSQPATSLKGKIGEINALTLDRGKETSFSSSLSVISSPSHKNNTDSDRAENRDSTQAMLPVLTPTGNMHCVSANTPNSASFERAEDEVQGGTDGNDNSPFNPINSRDDQLSLPDTSPLTFQYPSQISRTVGAIESRSLGQDNKDNSPSLVQGFTPRVYAWSMKTAEASLSLGSEAKSTTLLQNRGVLGPKLVPEAKLKKRSSETKSRRWTQKIKERWKERHGSLTKKGKEESEGEEDGKNEKELSPENHPSAANNLTNMSDKEGEMTRSADAPPRLSGDRTVEDHNRTPNDFEFGLGSFSLLDEIVAGHEWGRFLSPTPPGGIANQKLLELSTSQLGANVNCQDQCSGQSSFIHTQPGNINNQWNMREPESAAVLASTPISSDICMPVNMDISESNHVPAQDIKTELIQSEAMDHGHSQSDTEWNRAEQSGIDLKNTALVDFIFSKPADVLDNSSLKSRVQLNRKRVHRSQERGGEEDRMEEGEVRERKEAKRDESMYLPGTSISHVAHETEKINDNGGDMMSMSSLSSPPPSSSRPPVAVPRSALRHSISQDSESSISTETVTKKRRVEETRRVRFSEEVLTIAPINLDLDISVSDDDSLLEDDSSIEGDHGMQQTEQVETPASRPALPAWIKALKRMKTGKKTKR